MSSFVESSRAAIKGTPCSMCRCMSLLDPELRDEVNDALADPRCSDRAVLAELTKREVDALPALQQIGRHRRKECGGKTG